MISSTMPAFLDTAAEGGNSTNKKDDMVIYYYYHYDDNKDATVVAENISASAAGHINGASLPNDPNNLETDGGVEDTPYMDDPVPSSLPNVAANIRPTLASAGVPSSSQRPLSSSTTTTTTPVSSTAGSAFANSFEAPRDKPRNGLANRNNSNQNLTATTNQRQPSINEAELASSSQNGELARKSPGDQSPSDAERPVISSSIQLDSRSNDTSRGHKSAASDTVTIIHFNDCYNIEPGPKSSGAAGFLTAVNQYRHLNPLILFSGDILSPSFMSTFTKGEQMIPVLNDIGVHCAVFGNHEFDYGVDNLIDFTKRTTFPWLLSNVIDKETSNQLGDGLVYHILERAGIRIGLIGLIEEEWLSTLSTLDSGDVIYTDFVERGRELARWLKGPEQQVDYVIALTHFRTPNDIRLADSVPEIDLVLGGHDHDYEIIERPNCHIIKSGTDFREFSLIKLKLNAQYSTSERQQRQLVNGSQQYESSLAEQQKKVKQQQQPAQQLKPFSSMEIERVDCTDFAPEETLKCKLDKFVTTIDEKMGKVLGQFNCELDGRFSSIRKYETNLGNFVTDIMLASTHADLAILNSGTLRSDRIHPKGDFTMRDLFNILGYIDPIAVLQATGYHIWKALENGVSQWPKLEGRFPQISGCSFVFDPSKPALQRIDPADIQVGEEPLDLERQYKLTTKAYLASGKDGYDVLKECAVLVPGDESPDLTTSILNHFEAISIIKSNRRTHHRQSIICLSRSSIQKILDQSSAIMDEEAGEPQHLQPDANSDSNNNTDCAIPEDNDEESRLQDNTDGRQDSSRGHDVTSTPTTVPKHNGLGPAASTPLAGAGAPPTPTLGNMRPSADVERTPPLGAGLMSPPATIPKAARPAVRTKRMMSLYEMEHEQCKLEPKVEGRIKILGVNYRS